MEINFNPHYVNISPISDYSIKENWNWNVSVWIRDPFSVWFDISISDSHKLWDFTMTILEEVDGRGIFKVLIHPTNGLSDEVTYIDDFQHRLKVGDKLTIASSVWDSTYAKDGGFEAKILSWEHSL